MSYKLQIKPSHHSIVVAIPVILTLIGLFWALLPSGYVYADPARCDQPGWPSCYTVGYTDGQKNLGTQPVLVLIVHNFVVVGMMLQVRTLVRRPVPAE